jgi:cytochrome c oxidase subunit 3
LPNGSRGRTPNTHGHHHPALQHHFETLEQQHEASTLGMWLFLVTEVMFFGGMLALTCSIASWYPVAWSKAANELDIVSAASTRPS